MLISSKIINNTEILKIQFFDKYLNVVDVVAGSNKISKRQARHLIQTKSVYILDSEKWYSVSECYDKILIETGRIYKIIFNKQLLLQ